MKPHRVVVTGVGMVSPLGHTVESSWARLLQGRTATCAISAAAHGCFFPKLVGNDLAKRQQILDMLPAKVAAFVPVSDDDAAVGSSAVAADKKDPFAPTSRASRHQLFAEHAALEAMIMSGLIQLPAANGDSKATAAALAAFLANHSAEERAEAAAAFFCCPPSRRGVNVGVGMNSLHDIADASFHVYDALKLNRVEPFFVPKILSNTVSGALSLQYALRGPNHCTSTACATGAHCIGDAMRWIQTGDADLVVCGAAEAAVTPVGIAGFSRMKALATKFNDAPEKASRPFDRDRGGFVMGEGAGVLVLESEEHALRRGAAGRILCELYGYGMSGDAHHVSSPHPEGLGAQLAMRKAIDDPLTRMATATSQRMPGTYAQRIDPATDIWHLNAHATSTPMGDEIEVAAAVAALKPQRRLLVSSAKGNIGHLLGAAGAVETIFAVQSLRTGVVPATANLENPIETGCENVELVRGAPARVPAADCDAPRFVLANSFGFGGTNASLLLASYR